MTRTEIWTRLAPTVAACAVATWVTGVDVAVDSLPSGVAATAAYGLLIYIAGRWVAAIRESAS